MKVDVSQFRKRPTFEEVARIVNADSYKIDLSQQTFAKCQDTQAAVEFQSFKDQAQEGEMLRLQRQVYEANQRAAMPAPKRQPQRAVTVVAPGEGPIDAFTSSGEERGKVRRRGKTPPADVVMRGSSSDEPPDTGGASASTSRRQLAKTISSASTPEDTGRGPGGGGPGAGAGESGGALTAHEVTTMMRHFSAESSFAQNKLQEALAHHTQAHAQGVQTQVKALAASIAHESRRADARDQMTRDAMKSLLDTTASQIAGLPRPDTTAIQQSLEKMRIEAAAARAQPILLHDGSSDQQLVQMKKSSEAQATASSRQETLLGQIGNVLGGVMTHVHGQNATIQNVIDAVSKKPVTQQILNQYGTQYVDNRAVHQQQNVLNDNRSVEQTIINLFQQGGSSSSASGSQPPGPGGGGGGGGSGRGGCGRPMAIEVKPKQPEKRKAAIAAIEDRKKKKKTNPPDVPIPLPDRSGQAKRKTPIPREAPPPDDSQVSALARKIASMVKDKRRKGAMVPKIIDTRPSLPPPPLPPPFDPPPRSRAVVFKGKGRRLVDNDEPVAYPTIPIKVQNPKTKRKPGGVSGRARTQRFDQLALVPAA